MFAKVKSVTAYNERASPRPDIKILPGQAGGIVTLIFDLVTLSYRAPACPAK
jgi:hypothetical protein